tara:strand:- start:660 stop:905 length:246 start_codon:yes stop_codon:yes gene_type:complete
MSEKIVKTLEQHKSLFKEELDGEKIPLTRKNIQKATYNSINVINNGFAYNEYFKMGGTVGKMTFQSAKNFHHYTKNKQSSE